MSTMKNFGGIFKNLKNRTVLTYVAVVVIAPLFISGLVEYESLRKFLEILTQVVAILGLLDDPTTNYFFEK